MVSLLDLDIDCSEFRDAFFSISNKSCGIWSSFNPNTDLQYSIADVGWILCSFLPTRDATLNVSRRDPLSEDSFDLHSLRIYVGDTFSIEANRLGVKMPRAINCCFVCLAILFSSFGMCLVYSVNLRLRIIYIIGYAG